MNTLNINPGDVVATDYDFYQHLSVVSDTVDETGKFKLISATKRTGTVKEESWDLVTQGKSSYVAEIKTNHSTQEILIKAKSKIDLWSYSVLNNNCEHFIKWVNGLEITSAQVKSGVIGGVAGIALAKTLSEKPSFLKLFGGAVIVGGVAVALTRVSEKKTLKRIN